MPLFPFVKLHNVTMLTMKKPHALIQLIEELENEGIQTDLETTVTSKAVLFPDSAAAEADEGITLTAKECALLFANPKTTQRFLETLENAEDASLTFYELSAPAPVLELLERNLIALDEG